jgi:hypothetical protein
MSNPYTDLIPSANADQPKFLAMVDVITQGAVDNLAAYALFDSAWDLDTAVGAQLDVLGLWIGMPRAVQVPISGVYFSLDIAGVGLDQGVWFQTGNPLFSNVLLVDEPYRSALKAKALANRIGRSIYDIYSVTDILFSGTPTDVKIHDYGDMTMAFEITGATPDDATLAILSQDYLKLRPEGVALLPTILP